MLLFISAMENKEEQDVALHLWNTYKDTMYKIALSILKNEQDAEDAVQDTFLRMFKHIDQFYGEKATNVKSLVMIYTRGTCINNYNKRKKDVMNTSSTCNEEGVIMDIMDEETLSPEILIENQEFNKVLDEVLSKLDDKYKDVIVLKYFHGMRDSEIAQVLDITVNNVDVRMYRAKKQMQKILSKSKHAEILLKGEIHHE